MKATLRRCVASTGAIAIAAGIATMGAGAASAAEGTANIDWHDVIISHTISDTTPSL